MKEDIYISLFYWLEQLGHTVTMERERLEPSALNIVIGLQYLTRDQVRQLAGAPQDYGVFDVEFIAEGMINFKPQTAWLFGGDGRAFFDKCRFFISYFEESVRMVAGMGVFAHHIVPGYCPFLETPGRLPESEKTIDVFFFGNVDDHRRVLLNRIPGAINLKVDAPEDVTPLFLRNARADQARIILSLGRAPPFTHIGPMRLVSMAHLKAFVLSEPVPMRPSVIEELTAFWNEGTDPVEEILFWLDSPSLRRQRAEAAYQRMRMIDPLSPLGAALDSRR